MLLDYRIQKIFIAIDVASNKCRVISTNCKIDYSIVLFLSKTWHTDTELNFKLKNNAMFYCHPVIHSRINKTFYDCCSMAIARFTHFSTQIMFLPELIYGALQKNEIFLL